MPTRFLPQLLILTASAMFLAGCQSQPVAPNQPSPSPAAVIPSTQPETTIVQTEICGRFAAATVSQVTGSKVAPPLVTTVESSGGAKRHICTYTREGDSTTVVTYINVSFRRESTSEAYQQLWESQKTGQSTPATPVTGLGTEAFFGTVDNQPVLYVLTPEAQYWLRLGASTQAADRQRETLQRLARAALGS